MIELTPFDYMYLIGGLLFVIGVVLLPAAEIKFIIKRKWKKVIHIMSVVSFILGLILILSSIVITRKSIDRTNEETLTEAQQLIDENRYREAEDVLLNNLKSSSKESEDIINQLKEIEIKEYCEKYNADYNDLAHIVTIFDALDYFKIYE